jgi:predicted nucleic acid-binding protein
VLSETRKKVPNPRVLAFFNRVPPSAVYISALTIGELQRGVAMKQRTDLLGAQELASWVDAVEAGFADRILGIDTQAARLWGVLSAERSRPIIDTLLAATAISQQLTLVTRNIADMQDTGAKLYNPFKD